MTQQAIDLRMSLRAVLFAGGRRDRALEYLNQAEALAESAADEERLARVLCFRGLLVWANGEHERALAMSKRVHALASAKNNISLEAPARDVLGRAYYELGDFPRAVDVLTESVALLRDHPRERFGMAGFVSVHALSFLGLSKGEIGAFAEGYGYAREAKRIAEEADHPHSLVTALACESRLALYQGDLQAGTVGLERALAICENSSIGVWPPMLGAWLAYAYALAGRSIKETARLEQLALQSSPQESARLHRLATFTS